MPAGIFNVRETGYTMPTRQTDLIPTKLDVYIRMGFPMHISRDMYGSSCFSLHVSPFHLFGSNHDT